MKLTTREAAEYITDYLKENHSIEKTIKQSNISYLVQYGRITKYKENNRVYVDTQELIEYYERTVVKKNNDLLELFGEDYNPSLSFSNLSESETTKHVHKLHPYKGKYIPQLVEYFIDDKVDNFKKEKFFSKGDIILDPFLGSGTTIVEANEEGMESIGIDISKFNCLISNVKSHNYDIDLLEIEAARLLSEINEYFTFKIRGFDEELKSLISSYNNKFFPSPQYKREVQSKEIDEKQFSTDVLEKFSIEYDSLIAEFDIENFTETDTNSFLENWLLDTVKEEVISIKSIIDSLSIKDETIRELFLVVLTRTIRASRATKHSDLATLVKPQTVPYYCMKHYKICTPVNSCVDKFRAFLKDSIRRIKEYDLVRQENTNSYVIHGDSSKVNIVKELELIDSNFSKKVENQKIQGIFTSPPYLGVINYHDQHAYAYEILNIKRNDNEEIGKLSEGKGKNAKENYIKDMSNVFLNCKQYLVDDYDIFVVANDDMKLYDKIFENAGLKVVNKYERPVLNRTERNKKLYTETIFHCKER